MKNKLLFIIMSIIGLLLYKLYIFTDNQGPIAPGPRSSWNGYIGENNSFNYLYFGHKDQDGYQSENNKNLQSIKPIPFTPFNITSDDNSHNKDFIGYFWDSKETDETLIYCGKARIENDQFINAMVVDTAKIDTNIENNPNVLKRCINIFDAQTLDNNKFNPGELPQIGSYMKNGIIYNVYGQYLSTIVPEPKDTDVQVIGKTPNDGY